MNDERPLKSAFELAMDRLRAQDREAGVEQTAPLTEAQKQRIAELRGKARAKLAEIEIMYRKDRAAAGGDPEALQKVEERYLVDRRRVESKLESDVAIVRRGDDPADED